MMPHQYPGRETTAATTSLRRPCEVGGGHDSQGGSTQSEWRRDPSAVLRVIENLRGNPGTHQTWGSEGTDVRLDLWQLAADVTELTPYSASRLSWSDPLVALCRLGVSTGWDAQDLTVELWATWRSLAARLGSLRGDFDICRSACELPIPSVGEFLVLATVHEIGPVGWFVADALATMGRLDEAIAANAAATETSRRLQAAPWISRCEEQGQRLNETGMTPVTDSSEDPEPRTPAEGGTAHEKQLSGRQLEILRLAAAGLTNAQIAERLFVSIATVERHCTIAYRTLGVRNRAQALSSDLFPGAASA